MGPIDARRARHGRSEEEVESDDPTYEDLAVLSLALRDLPEPRGGRRSLRNARLDPAMVGLAPRNGAELGFDPHRRVARKVLEARPPRADFLGGGDPRRGLGDAAGASQVAVGVDPRLPDRGGRLVGLLRATLVELLVERGDGLGDEEISKKANTWVKLNGVRAALGTAGFLAALRALSTPPSTD